ncbi:GMC oxidoreductase-domain-containing protein [Mycena vulgaris]|nr:GMC oxidoreductase-domain-containing protein [Mycena vulgaris]
MSRGSSHIVATDATAAPSFVLALLPNNHDSMVFHLLGTAVIGEKSNGGAVDQKLRVYGTPNVFVADGSIIPTQPSSHPPSIIYAIGDKAAALPSAPTTQDV